MGVDVDTVPCVEQRRSGRRGGVEELLGCADSCRRCGRVGIRSGARQLSIRRQVRACRLLQSYLPKLFTDR